VDKLAGHEDDVVGALQLMADYLNAPVDGYAVNEFKLPGLPTGKLTTGAAAAIVARLLPEEAIICGDSGGGGAAFGPCQSAARHIWLNLTGGSIGQGGPAAVGAAIASPESRVLALLGDGAFMYTNQALWTQARENLNVTSVIFNNQKYGILQTEYLRLGVNEIGERAGSMFNLSEPDISYVDMAKSMGVPGEVVRTAEDFSRAMEVSFSQPGPYLLEAIV
jgi:acetolactate synthase-1/2/3 large subunit